MIGSSCYEYSDFVHGHCASWDKQQSVLPYFGRWEPKYRIQWQALQYIGGNWAHNGVAHSDDAMVNYARKIIQGGGVITFDLGARDSKNELDLTIKADQLAQLRLIRDAVKDIPANDGAAMRQATLQGLLLTINGDEMADDGKTWQTVFEKNEHDGTPIDSQITPIKTQYIRVIAIKPDGSSREEKGDQMQVTELEVYQ